MGKARSCAALDKGAAQGVAQVTCAASKAVAGCARQARQWQPGAGPPDRSTFMAASLPHRTTKVPPDPEACAIAAMLTDERAGIRAKATEKRARARNMGGGLAHLVPERKAAVEQATAMTPKAPIDAANGAFAMPSQKLSPAKSGPDNQARDIRPAKSGPKNQARKIRRWPEAWQSLF